jgi:hypothetical protein
VYEIGATIQQQAPGFIEWAQKEAPELVKKIEGFDARMTALEHVAQRNHALLNVIASRLGITNVNGLPIMAVVAPDDAQQIAQAAIDEASGRS